MSVAVVDSGGANLGSVLQALNRLGADSQLTRDAECIQRASHVILPGVGAAAAAMDALKQAGLVATLRQLRQPVMGICLGLQLLFERSEEGDVDCLGVLPGTIRALPEQANLRLPHMGWNQLSWQHSDPLSDGLAEQDWFYFVHSYAAPVEPALATSQHGHTFAAVVRKDNFAACQFHPEKSAGAGQRLLRNFLTQ
ncbi:MAG: imidazole glycerol phosphate synthase subunit HisH [Pseudomonadota bacterium]